GMSLNRDATDVRLINNLTAKTGTIIASQTQPGYIAPASVSCPPGFDTNHHGTRLTSELADNPNGPSASKSNHDSALLNPAGGSLLVLDTITVGYTNTGAMQIDTGNVIAQNVVLGNTLSGVNYSGSLTLNGGTLQTRQIVLGAGTPGNWTSGGTITFNGGTVQ